MSAPAVLVLTCSLDELRALVREEVRATRVEPAPSTLPLVDRRELARLLGVSAATVTRMTQEGMPHVFAGASPRYSFEAVQSWLDARGRRGTHAAVSKTPGPVAGVRLLSRGSR